MMTIDEYNRKLLRALNARFKGERQADMTVGGILGFCGALADEYAEHYGEPAPIEVSGVTFQPDGVAMLQAYPSGTPHERMTIQL